MTLTGSDVINPKAEQSSRMLRITFGGGKTAVVRTGMCEQLGAGSNRNLAPNGPVEEWRATVDEDGHYCCAVTL
jgi:hypothetical protein